MICEASPYAVPAAVRPRAGLARPWPVDALPETPGAATGRALLSTVWQRLCNGEIECIDVHLRSGPVVTDLIALRVYGPIAEGAQGHGDWSHAFALDDVAVVRGVRFGRLR